jgi:L-fucose mutarotase/ribose pyranase (RbsD/FucU family)
LALPPIPRLDLAADTGLSSADRITNNGTIRVSGLVTGATWQYSLNGGATWLTGSGTSFLVTRGSYASGQVWVRQRNSAGQFSAANTTFAAFTVDNTVAAPRMALQTDTGSAASDRITNNGTIEVFGLEEGATWQYSLNGGSTWLNGSGTTFLVPQGSYAAGRVRVRQRDVAGNLSAANTSFAAFTVDTVVAAPRLALVADTGSSTTDRITRNPSLVVSGLESGATWQVSLDGGETWQNGSGSTVVLADGSYSAGQVQVRQIDRAGNTSPANTPFAAFTIDTAVAPPALALVGDTGSSATDRITNNPEIMVSGLEEGATWQYSLNGGASWITDTGSGFVLADGSYSAGQVRVRQIDRAGNTSTANTSLAAFTVDTVAAAPALALAADTGSSSSDRITSNTTIQVSGLEEGASWEYTLNGGSSWTSGSGSSFSLADGSYGAGQVQVRQTDRAGNNSATNTTVAAFTIDTEAAAPGLALAADMGSSASDRITNNRTIQVLGLEEGASWQYSLNGGSSWINGSGNSVVLADGSYGAAQVQVRQTDRAGNSSPAHTAFAAFTIDTVAGAPGLALAADTGSSATDRVTGNRTVQVSGLEEGASWEYSLNGGASWTRGNGSSVVLADGSYGAGQVQVRQTDRAGNTSAANTSLAAFTIDTVVAVPVLALAADTGSSASDRITNNRTINVSGLEEGASWQYSLNGGSSWINGSGNSFVLAEGSYSAAQVQVRQTDMAGNSSAAHTSFAAFTIDTAAAAPGLALAADTGSSATDRITGNRTVQLSGLEEGASWEYSLNGGSSWTSGSGTSFDLADGRYGAGQVQVRQTDRAGNSSGANTSFPAFTIDTVVAVPVLALAADTGSSATDRITNNPAITVSGLEEGASWQYSLNGGSSWINGSGSNFVLADGGYSAGQVLVRQTDVAGNTSAANTSFAAFTIDTAATAPGLALAADTGSSASDRITNNATLTVSGLEEGASWQYSLNGGSSWQIGTGSSVVLADGSYAAGQVQVRQSDRAGNTSAVNTSFAAFTLDTAAPVAPALALAADTGSSTTDGLTNNPIIQLSGLEAGATWEYSINGGSSWRTGTGSSLSLADGSYGAGQVRVRQSDRAGNTSAVSTALADFTIDTLAAAPAMALLEDSGSSASDRITSNGTILVSGLEAGATWQFSLNGGSSWQNGTGNRLSLTDGTYAAGQVQVRQIDAAGNTSTGNAAFGAFTVDSVAAAPGLNLAADTGSSASDRITNNGTILVVGLEAGAIWEYSLNGGSSWQSGSGTSVTLAQGTYTAGQVQVRQTDRAGNTSAALTGFAPLTVDTVAAAAPGLALADDTGISASDRITSNGTILVSGLDAGATWEFSLNGGTSWQTGSGSSVSLADGTYATGQVQVRQTDAAGNTSAANTGLLGVTVDRVAAAPGLMLAADTGSSASDRITNNGTINVLGLEEGATWTFSLDGGNSWQTGTGSSLSLSDGSYTAGQVRVRQIDRAGNTSAANTSFAAFTVDSLAAVPTMVLAEDTGNSAADRVTSNGTIAVSGLDQGATWQYSTDRGQNWRTGSGSSFAVPPGTYADGQVQVRQLDQAGNWSAANTGFAAFTVTLPSLSIAAVDANKAEGNTGTTAFTFQITRSGDTSIASSVAWAVIGSGSNRANALDFAGDALPSGTVTFAAGETTKTITLQVVADTLFGPDESFAVTLSNPTNAAIASATASGVIRNDDLSIQQPVFVRETTLPDGALGAITGKGWTGTGLVHDPWENVFWVANHGQATKTSPYTPSIVKMTLNAGSVLAQIDVKSLFPDNTTIQGLTLDSSNQSLWFAATLENKIRNVTKGGASLGELSFNRPNGLTYDPQADRLIVLHKTGTEPGGSSDHTISEINKTTGAIIRSYITGPVYGADQLYFDPATRYLYLTYGADPSPGDVRVFDHDAGKQIGTIGSFSKVTATEGIAIVGDNIFMVSDDYFDPDPRNPDITNRLVSYRHVPVASSEGRDVITGTAAAETFSWGSLAKTSLVSYDTIVNYSSNDKIAIDGLRYNRTLNSSLGSIASLTYANLITFLNNTRLPASAAAAFTVAGMSGTFVALNDQGAAFHSETDGLVFLKQYTIGSANTVSIV